MRHRHADPAGELADLRAELVRLQARERALVAMLEGDPARQAVTAGRTGWPIQRQVVHAAAQ